MLSINSKALVLLTLAAAPCLHANPELASNSYVNSYNDVTVSGRTLGKTESSYVSGVAQEYGLNVIEVTITNNATTPLIFTKESFSSPYLRRSADGGMKTSSFNRFRSQYPVVVKLMLAAIFGGLTAYFGEEYLTLSNKLSDAACAKLINSTLCASFLMIPASAILYGCAQTVANANYLNTFIACENYSIGLGQTFVTYALVEASQAFIDLDIRLHTHETAAKVGNTYSNKNEYAYVFNTKIPNLVNA